MNFKNSAVAAIKAGKTEDEFVSQVCEKMGTVAFCTQARQAYRSLAYTCDYCEISYLSALARARHVHNYHKAELDAELTDILAPVGIEVCGKGFETVCNLPKGHKGMCGVCLNWKAYELSNSK